ncbi:hypothetical protein CR513_03457, partial [Mucuna pruriens]
MENKIEELELKNQDLKGEVSQLKEQMAQMFQILSQTNAAIITMVNHDVVWYTQAGNTIGPLPHTESDPPYGMPHGWNTEDPANEKQEQSKVEVQHQASRTTQPLMVHKRTPLTKDKWKSLEEWLHVVEGGNQFRLKAMDLYLVPDVDLLANFKTSKLDMYKGNSYPRAHLVMYCRKMAAYIYDDKILVHCFQDILTGATLSWYVSLERGHVKTWRD